GIACHPPKLAAWHPVLDTSVFGHFCLAMPVKKPLILSSLVAAHGSRERAAGAPAGRRWVRQRLELRLSHPGAPLGQDPNAVAAAVGRPGFAPARERGETERR